MTIRQVERFFTAVMLRLGYYDWNVHVHTGTDSYCWISSKVIDVGLGYDGDVRQIMLHEIAHIDTARFCNQKHTPVFWKRLEYLTWKFLDCGLDAHQLAHRQWQSEGMYRKEFDICIRKH